MAFMGYPCFKVIHHLRSGLNTSFKSNLAILIAFVYRWNCWS